MKNLKTFKKFYSFKKINLEKLSLRHLNDIHEYSTDERFFKYFEYRKFVKKTQTRKYIIKKLKDVKNSKSIWWSIKLKNNEKVIGTICVYNINFLRKTCEIGYGINPNYWKKGYFTETLNGLLKIILNKKKFLRCQAITAKNNKSSINGLINCGFKKEGILRKFYSSYNKNKNCDAVLLAKII